MMSWVVTVFAIVLFGGFAFQSIYPGDAGDLVTAAFLGGIPHPPGYPLYTWLGWLVTRAPGATPAWLVSWISIIAHAVTAGLVFLLVQRLTNRTAPALFAVLVLLGNYLFFLYSVTPEVFALLDMFVVLLTYLAIRLRDRFTWRLVFFFFFVVGLSMSHHPIIVLLFPALFLYVRRRIVAKRWDLRRILVSVGAGILGLVPYGYIAVAARGDAIVNWDRPVSIWRFFQLISRADYGTFVTGGTVGQSMYERLLNVRALFTFLVVDFTWIGIVLFVVGLVWLWYNKRGVFSLLFLSWLLLGPGFVFYASFTVINRFVLGTYERFLLPSYLFVAILAGIGVWVTCEKGARLLMDAFKRHYASGIVARLCMGVLFVYPLTMGSMTIWRFWGSSTDMTSDMFIRDVLDSSPPRAIILLSHDTPLFGAQYMRYAVGYRLDTIVLHLSRLTLPDYHEVIAKTHPDIVIPPLSDSFISDFVIENGKNRPVATNTIIPTPDDWVWVPRGLLFVLTPKDEVPDTQSVVAQNSLLWSSFQDPGDGLLSRYNHLLLSNVRDEYASSAVAYGKVLVRAGNYAEAKTQFIRATRYESDSERESAWTYVGLSELFLDDCWAALESFEKAKESSLVPNPEIFQYEAVTYRDCIGDDTRARELFSQYEDARKKSERSLETL